MRCKPKFGSYNGLTVVLSNPSRFDSASISAPNQGQDNLLKAGAGRIFDEQCLRPITNMYQCDIRTKEDMSPLLPNTRCILLLGQDAMHGWLPKSRQNTIGELRGSPYDYNGTIAIPSFFPQDAADIKNYEAEFNSENQTPLINEDDIDEEDNESALSDKRQHGRTKRKNYAFWLSVDTKKALAVIKADGKIPIVEPTPTYIIYPPSDTIIQELLRHKNEYLYFDIETDSNLNILCFAFAFNSQRIFVVPVQNHNYQWAYSSIPNIFRSLSIAIRDNILVAHNGAAFDFFLLAYKYHIPIGRRVYDTMVAGHRCYPEIEKSLGHMTSLWTWQQFHKDEGNGRYFTQEDEQRMWHYCGKDVYTMSLIHAAIEKHCDSQIGLRQSIQQANDSIRPYLIATLQGIHYNQKKLEETMIENDKLMTQYLRILLLLIGPDSTKEITGSKTLALNPNSNPQCCKYFHELLGYAPVARSPKTGKPSLAKKAMYKLRLKYENLCIDFILAFRELRKESGTLKFVPWKQ